MTRSAESPQALPSEALTSALHSGERPPEVATAELMAERPAGLPLLSGAVPRGRRTGLLVGLAVALLGGLIPAAEVLYRAGTHQLSERLLHALSGGSGVCLIAGLALVAAALNEGSRRLSRTVQVGGAMVLVLVAAALVLGGLGSPRSASGISVLSFVLLGCALLHMDHKSQLSPHPAEWLALSVGWLGGLALTGAMLGVSPQYRLTSGLASELVTSMSLIALGVGILCARPDRGLAAIAASATSGGTLMRRLVPMTLSVPPLGIWVLVDVAPRVGLFDSKFGAALGVLLGGALLAAIEVKLAATLAAQDAQKQQHNHAMRRALGDLARALRERDRVQKDLERSNRDLDEFAYAASHDLRAPLRGIANLAHWIEEDLGPGLPDSARKQLELLRGRVHRMESLIDGILHYSRAGRGQDPLVQVAVEPLLRECIELVSPPPGARIEIGPGMPTLVTERAQLQQVFLNLISNAVKHAHRDDPHVRITVEDQGDVLRFGVADNGPGIPAQYQERIWGMFQTLESRDQVEGTGIGLATVKKLVERRGGRVGVESPLHDSSEGASGTGGARFYFLWPRQHGG